MSTFTHIPHPRISARRHEKPAQRSDEYIGFNGRLAALMTRGVGSMWVVYFTTAFVLIWMFLAQAGPLSFDRYPFAFLLLMGNVVQLLLVFVILVGQEVLGAATDRRAVQTYEDAEAILHEVEQIHSHLEAQDQTLTKGILALKMEPHPWIADHRIQKPVQVDDMHVGFNGRLAARLTRGVGTMWAFYFGVVFQLAWMGLALAGVLSFDPYPFAFLLFLSSLAQLILMFVILVGQNVLGKATDERALQTYQDAEAILHECARLQEHLSAQDQIIAGIVDHLEQHAAANALNA